MRKVVLGLLGVGAALLIAPAVLSAQPGKRSGCPERFPLGGDQAQLPTHGVTCKKARKVVLVF
jgi:hypothetical protein